MKVRRLLLAFYVFSLFWQVFAQNEQNDKYVLMPEDYKHWKHVSSYIERTPEPDYDQASSEARDMFDDLKYGVRIHWGVYSLKNLNASWNLVNNLSLEECKEYHNLYKTWNPQHFDADEWMKLFKDNGMKMFAFTAKHHDGFSMYDTKTKIKSRVTYGDDGEIGMEACDLSYSIMETPFKRDVVKELCEAANKAKLKIDLYYSHPDWYDADFRPYCHHPLQTLAPPKILGDKVQTPKKKHLMGTVPARTPEEIARGMKRHREQLEELLTNYGKIDMVCLDMHLGEEVWPYLRQTMKKLRTIQPEVMFRSRGIGNYGDYYTPEGFVPGEKSSTRMPWFVIYPLAKLPSYVPNASSYKGSDWIISNLIDAVSKGGNFMVGIGPDGNGAFHPEAIKQIREAGDWLKVNGEAIYSSRAREGELYKEGEHVHFTRSKDNEIIYAIATSLENNELRLNTVKADKGSKIYMLGYDKALSWHEDDGELVIEIPEVLQEVENRPCEYAWSFKIYGEDRSL